MVVVYLREIKLVCRWSRLYEQGVKEHFSCLLVCSMVRLNEILALRFRLMVESRFFPICA